MLDKLAYIEKKYLELREQMMDPEIISDNKKSIQLSRDLSGMQEIYDLYQDYKKAHQQKHEAQEMIDTEQDSEMLEMAKEQLKEAENFIEDLDKKIKVALLPKDPNDDKNIYLEIRPAAGGDEAGLFATELLKMYLGYATKKGWKPEIVEQQLSDIGGVKFAMVKISGNNVYSIMKFESGVHRVQRIPTTESQGRVHTSTVTVAIMPEAEDLDFQIDPKDVEMDVYAGSSSGGQNANKNQTGVRLRHIPSGLIVDIGDSKSQLHNKDKAWSVLKARLYQIELDKKTAETKSLRGDQIGSGDRSEKIRTYNYPQDRVTDHRIHQSWSNLPVFLTGEIDDMINALVLENQTRLLEESMK
ncbi:MAG TPA: peptide chain release factor 1 [Candidatus Absconditabacterales bacterium]|nr:peptide chain release factor 1 [Candidatus Absconditabacterales bacterium]